MRKHTCHLDLRQRSLYVTIGQKNWFQKLLDNHEKKLLDSHKEKLLDKQSSSNQPNQTHNQSVIDQGNLITNTMCLLKKAKHPGLERSKRDLLPGLERSRRHLFTKNSVLQIDQGNLINMKLHYEQLLKYIVRLRRSTPTMSYLVKELRKIWTSKFQDYHILL